MPSRKKCLDPLARKSCVFSKHFLHHNKYDRFLEQINTIIKQRTIHCRFDSTLNRPAYLFRELSEPSLGDFGFTHHVYIASSVLRKYGNVILTPTFLQLSLSGRHGTERHSQSTHRSTSLVRKSMCSLSQKERQRNPPP